MDTRDWLLIEEWLLFALIASYSVQGLLALRVVMRRRSVGVTFAWLTVILAVPVLGVVLYLLVGELRLGGKRAKRAELVHGPYQDWLRELQPRARSAWDALPSSWV
ncbi:MAG TPA: PLDc N-terminal domain-containing protein, partial [Pirellulaceae bacterium]|nr:PLDc N-terminal domain-containing protein [Pirellulaceae bacterium]